MTRFARGWGPAALWAAVLFWQSSRPSLPSPAIPGLDKVAHFCLYAVLGVLLARAGERTGVGPIALTAIGLLYGLSDEFHQSFVPGRSMEVADWVADALGTIAGILLFRWHRNRQAIGSASPRPFTSP